LRIIAGKLKGKKLYPLKGLKIRPTSDRLKEALFNILAPRLPQAVVLDLFAGTGALGLEALSRGARTVVFIDNHAKALLQIKKNIVLCGVENDTKMIKWNPVKSLNCLKTLGFSFNLVMMDPPYDMDTLRPVFVNLEKSDCLQQDAKIIVEHHHAVRIPEMGCFIFEETRKYGNSQISFFNYSR
jgi:16S rRNA (guanine966-N2)-methyltransferase